MKVAGEDFNVRIDGSADAPPLMLSNSLGTDLTMWDGAVEDLARRYRVIRYDSRGHGESVAESGPYSIAQLGRDALAILDALDVKVTHWVGVSKGGMVGQWLLAHAGARISRAVLANTTSHYQDPGAWNARITTVRTQGMVPIVSGVIERWFTPSFRANEPAVVDRFAASLLATPAQGYATACAAIRDMDLREACRGVVNPTLVIVGKHDAATPPELGRGVAARIRNASVYEIDAAHLSNVERPREFSRAVLEFLEAGT